ncbi:MAG: type II toxin-antitoxin system Phd/YefM family antitoxin [Bryobacteraceae bacterium]
MEVNTHYAKTHLSKLLEKALLGEEIVIARAGKPVARLVRVAPPGGKRKLGTARGRIWFSEGWDAPMSQKELRQFMGT